MKKNVSTAFVSLLFLAIGAFLCILPVYAQEVHTSSVGLATRIAPGEFLPFSVKLLNFGQARRSDVTITYQVFTLSGTKIYTESETVAVETTANFVKRIQIPRDIPEGNYTLVSSIVYQDQEAPAISQFSFSVEFKIFGMFQTDLFRYGGFTLAAVIVAVILARLLMKRLQSRLVSYEYSDKPRDERIYYKIVSDVIAQMRVHAGDAALEIASHIPDLTIDTNTGRVLAIKKDPEKILASLVLRYETLLGRNVHIASRY